MIVLTNDSTTNTQYNKCCFLSFLDYLLQTFLKPFLDSSFIIGDWYTQVRKKRNRLEKQNAKLITKPHSTFIHYKKAINRYHFTKKKTTSCFKALSSSATCECQEIKLVPISLQPLQNIYNCYEAYWTLTSGH